MIGLSLRSPVARGVFAARRGSTLRTLVACLAWGVVACGPAADRESAESQGVDSRDPPTITAAPRALPETSTGELLDRSFRYHDPDNVWDRQPIRLQWVSTRPGGERRVATVAIDNAAGRFELEMEFRGALLEMDVEGEDATVRVDGSTDIDQETRDRLRLDLEGGLYWRNYFLFLVGLPMKILDPGTGLAEAPTSARFEGREVQAIHATYETADGYPNWEFYFDPDTAGLVGARFWREARDVDGEYIVMSGVAEAGPLRIPQVRDWYMSDDGEHLGTDEVRGLHVGG